MVKMPTFANNAHTLEIFKSMHTQMPLICMLALHGVSPDRGGHTSLGMSHIAGSG